MNNMPVRFSKLPVAILLAFCMTTNPVMLSASEIKGDVPRINVIGTADVKLEPDMAILTLGVHRKAATARQALDANNEAMAEVLTSMKEAGIAGRDLQTSNFSIRPLYVHHRPKEGEEQKPPRIVGYAVSNELTVKVRDLEKTGDILDRSVTLGVNSGGNVTFTNDDPKEAISKARAKAMEDALDRATTLTGAAGVSLGQIISIDENFNPPRPVPFARGRMQAEAAMADSVPVAPGENTYSVTVNVSWEIKQ